MLPKSKRVLTREDGGSRWRREVVVVAVVVVAGGAAVAPSSFLDGHKAKAQLMLLSKVDAVSGM
jgi:hypothetical protein